MLRLWCFYYMRARQRETFILFSGHRRCARTSASNFRVFLAKWKCKISSSQLCVIVGLQHKGSPFSVIHVWAFVLCSSFVGNTEVEIDVKRYYCKAGIKSIQVRRARVVLGPRASEEASPGHQIP